jgi:hypothetical protein
MYRVSPTALSLSLSFTDLALGFEGMHDPQLVLGRGPSKDVAWKYHILERLIC